MDRRLRYRDLLAKGIVKNRTTLGNWIRDRGFPPGQMTGPNTRTWGEGEIEDYLDSRPSAPKPAIPTKRPRGRPRKTASTVEAT
jgi:predicted DNA-binding transcriptional regulator AlpA